MTIIAQFNDCHCCNDARSLVQKKKRQGQFHVREKQQKHSQSLTTIKRINQTKAMNKNPPRMSASETRDPFQSRVINGAPKKRRIGAEKPWLLGLLFLSGYAKVRISEVLPLNFL